jgi:membrane protein YqaA with SNARE-associated domain
VRIRRIDFSLGGKVFNSQYAPPYCFLSSVGAFLGCKFQWFLKCMIERRLQTIKKDENPTTQMAQKCSLKNVQIGLDMGTTSHGNCFAKDL